MKSLNITELKAINGGEVNDARRNGEKIGNLLREANKPAVDFETFSPLKG
ncbi:bacteriocin [Staphylococcus hominis]|nr:bacteriocin [Staphylococcus hominis]MDS3905718.1 bacteriocin [Staphylococcus hominis]